MPKIKHTSIETLVFEENEWKFKKITKTLEFDQFVGQFGAFIQKGESVTTYSTLEEHGYAKTQRMTVLVKRYAINPKNLKQLSAIFTQEIEAHIPSGEEYKNWFLSISKAIIKRNARTKKDKLILPSYFMIQKLDEGTAQALNYHNSIVKRVGPEKRIGPKQAVKMLKEGLVGAILEEDLEGNFTRMGI